MSRELRPCGTEAAYRRHITAGEQPCEPCREAKREKARRQYRQRVARYGRRVSGRGLPASAPEGAHKAPCFGDPGLWDPRGEWEPDEAVLARWREAARLCVSACPVFTHCRDSRVQAGGRGVWAGRIPGRVA